VAEFWLHYVGSGLYKREVFEREAVKYGVQRAVPFSMLKRFEFGASILLAYYREGKAEVFGYFNVNGLTHNLPKEVYEDLLETVDVVRLDNTSVSVSRACGSYTVGSTAYIDETLESLVEKIKQACERHGVDPKKFKWFLTGRYHPFKTGFVLTPAKFTRSYMKVDIEGLDIRRQEGESERLLWVFDYERRTYLSKRERGALLSQKITVFV